MNTLTSQFNPVSVIFYGIVALYAKCEAPWQFSLMAYAPVLNATKTNVVLVLQGPLLFITYQGPPMTSS